MLASRNHTRYAHRLLSSPAAAPAQPARQVVRCRACYATDSINSQCVRMQPRLCHASQPVMLCSRKLTRMTVLKMATSSLQSWGAGPRCSVIEGQARRNSCCCGVAKAAGRVHSYASQLWDLSVPHATLYKSTCAAHPPLELTVMKGSLVTTALRHSKSKKAGLGLEAAGSLRPCTSPKMPKCKHLCAPAAVRQRQILASCPPA